MVPKKATMLEIIRPPPVAHRPLIKHIAIKSSGYPSHKAQRAYQIQLAVNSPAYQDKSALGQRLRSNDPTRLDLCCTQRFSNSKTSVAPDTQRYHLTQLHQGDEEHEIVMP